MKLIPPELLQKLPPLGATRGKSPEQVEVFFHLIDHASREFLFPTEYDPRTRVCYGLVVADHALVMRHFSLDDLESCRDSRGRGVELFYLSERNLAEVREGLDRCVEFLDKFLVYRMWVGGGGGRRLPQ